MKCHKHKNELKRKKKSNFAMYRGKNLIIVYVGNVG